MTSRVHWIGVISLKTLLIIIRSARLENTYEGLHLSQVTGLQPATLLKMDFFIDKKQRFLRRIHKNLPHSFNLYLISVDGCSYSNNWITQLIESIYKWMCILRFILLWWHRRRTKRLFLISQKSQ